MNCALRFEFLNLYNHKICIKKIVFMKKYLTLNGYTNGASNIVQIL